MHSMPFSRKVGLRVAPGQEYDIIWAEELLGDHRSR